MKCEHIDCVCWASCNMSIGSLSRPQPYLLNQWALFSVCGELTALLDFVSVGRGFSFIQRMRRSPSTSNIPYLRVSIKTRTEQKTVNSFCKVKLEAWFLLCLLYKLTLVFALVRQHQAAVLTLRLVVRKRLFHFTEAEIFFEQGVTVDGKEAASVGETDLEFTAQTTSLWRHIDHVNSVNSPPNHQDMVVYLEVLHCQLQTGHSTKTPLMEGRKLT